MSGREILSTIDSLGVQHAPASAGKIQHGVIASAPMLGTQATYTNVGDGSPTDLTATTQAHIGNSGAYLDGDGDQPLTQIGTLATIAIGDAYAPWGEERCLMVPTERGFALLFEHGFEDVPQGMKMGERFILHRANPNGNYETAVYDAGVRLLNDGTTLDDGLGTTEIGNDGDQTVIKTKSGEITITASDTLGTIVINVYGNIITITKDPSITLETPGGLVHQLDDTTGVVAVGALAASLDATRALLAKADATTLTTNIIDTSLTKLASAIGVAAAAAPNLSSFGSALQAAGFVTSIAGITPVIPSGSSKARAAL